MRRTTDRTVLMAVAGLAAMWLAAGVVHAAERAAATDAAASVLLVEAGKARAVVVTGAAPSPVAAYAAQELVAHVERSTGVRLETVREGTMPAGDRRVHVYVGDTKAARGAGLDPDALPGETFRIKAGGGNLYILGRENDQELIDWKTGKIVRDTLRGTLYGVIEFLDRCLGVRWLWPGELGTYVPRRDTLAVTPSLEVTGGPAFRFREYRIWGVERAATRGYKSALEGRLGFTQEGVRNYHKALCRFLLIHQEGETEPQPRVGHHFQGWWRKYGKEHPEWFVMRDDGERGPKPGADACQVCMCVSNPELHRSIVEQDWDGGAVLSLGEADSRGYCLCPECKAGDAPQPEGFSLYSTSNRYARFWKAVRDLAAKRNPNVQVAIFLYMTYMWAPTIDIDLTGVYGEFVPWSTGRYNVYYPMAAADHELNKQTWLGWSKTGMTIAYRPNYLLCGYAMPHLSTWQAGEMYRFAAAHGMVGFDFDSLFGRWAVKGPMLYMHMRLGTDPTRSIADIRSEYFSAFGPAMDKVESYFDYWEEYSSKKAPRGGVSFSDASVAGKLYPPKAFPPAEAMLAEALVLARTSGITEFSQRVEFLQAGLEHAKRSAKFSRLYAERDFPAARQTLLDLVAFRRAHEHEFIDDYVADTRAEVRGYSDLGDLLDGNMLVRTDSGLLAIPPGTHSYSDGFGKRSSKPLFPPIETAGFRPGLWGYCLDAGQEGKIVHCFKAREGCAFASFHINPWLMLSASKRTKRTYNRVEFSRDGQHYETLYENVNTYKNRAYWDISERTQGLNEFYIRISAGFPKETALMYVAMKLKCSVKEKGK